MIPYANGIKVANPILIDYISSKAETGTLKTTAELIATIEDAQLPGLNSSASLIIDGNSVATHNSKSKELKNHTYELTSNLQFEYTPGSPIRAVLHTKVTIEKTSHADHRIEFIPH